MTRRKTIVLALLVLLAAIVRIPGLFTDFWGDEIWSWSIAGQLHSARDVLLSESARIDNNHPLNTLWLYTCGQDASVWLYRLPALLAGIGSVIVAVHIMSRRNFIAAVAAAVLIGFSFPLIFYSSEARGYSLAVLFGLMAFDALEIALETGGGWACAVFAVAASLGFLSHLTFLHLYAGAFVWSVIGDAKARGARRQTRRRESQSDFSSSRLPSCSSRLRVSPLVRLHALPIAVACLLFTLFIKHMIIGGAAPTDPKHVILWTLSLALGGPNGGIGCLIVATVAIALFAVALRWEREWTFYLVTVILSPALTTIRELGFAEHPQPLMVRYFLVCLAFLLLALCPLIARGWKRSRVMRDVIALGGVVFLIGNLGHLIRFERVGRGNVERALAHMAAQTPEGPIEIGTDNLPRTRMLLSFYQRRMQPARQIALSESPAKWVVFNRSEASGAAIIEFEDAAYVLDSVYPSDALSGWAWLVYRKK